MGKFDSAETPFRNGFTSLDQAGKHVEGAGAFNMILKTSIPGSQRHIETVSPWPQQQRGLVERLRATEPFGNPPSFEGVVPRSSGGE